MPHEPVFPHATFKSHMPFFDGRTLVFCRANAPRERTVAHGGAIWQIMDERPHLRAHFAQLPRSSVVRYQPWELAYVDWTNRQHARRIETGLPEGTVHCCPAFYRQGSDIQMSFVAGVPAESGLLYHLYHMSGPSWEHLGAPRRVCERPVRFGFISPHHVCVGGKRQVLLTNRTTGQGLTLSYSLKRIYRVSFRADQSASLLVTGMDERDVELTLLHRLDSDEVWEVQGASHVYKSTVYGDRLVFAQRGDSGFEDRHLRHGPYTLRPSKILVSRSDAPALPLNAALLH